jgi:hypothetical protein
MEPIAPRFQLDKLYRTVPALRCECALSGIRKYLNQNGMGSIGSRKVRILRALLFATLVTGCYGPGWGGGSPGYYSNNYYSNDVYRGYGSYPRPGLFGGYAPANEAWAASGRGRTSYGGGHFGGGGGGGHGGGGHGR